MVKIVLLKSDADHMHRMKLMHTPEDAFIMILYRLKLKRLETV